MNKVRPDRPISSRGPCYKLWYLGARMQAASRRTLDPAGAGGVLLLGIVVCVGIGALVGWAAGSVGIGILIGAVVGIPAGVFAVYRRYGGGL
jgi:F0F1-type ATP synthase assembly protein I